LELCIDLHENSGFDIYIESVFSDDDSTIRTHLQHAENDGKLPDHIPTPKFLADPSHRVKVMSSPFFKMAQGEKKDPMLCKKIKAIQLKNYIGCWIYQNNNLPIDQFMEKAKAPVEHLFDCHEWCDVEWCWAKQLSEKELELTTYHTKQMHKDNGYESDSSTSSWETVDSNATDLPSTTTPAPHALTANTTIDSDDGDDDPNFMPGDCVEDSDKESEADMGLDEDELKECSFFKKIRPNLQV
jgi:hypothetical protein